MAYKKYIIILLAAVVLVLGGFFILRMIAPGDQTDPQTAKALTINDLANPKVDISSDTSDASVENLSKELKSKIDKQIASKENPIDTVKSLASVLSNTTNAKRQDGLVNFVEGFLANHEDALWFKHEGDMPEQAQVNYWKGELYAYLVYNLQILMSSNFTEASGTPRDTAKQQIKYIDLYLAMANDPASHPPIADEYKDIFVGYIYSETDNFLALKRTLTEQGAA